MDKFKSWIGYVIIAIAIAVAGVLGVQYPAAPPLEVGSQAAKAADFIIATTNATATPGVVINNKSAGSVSLELQAASTPAAQIYRAGGADFAGNVQIGSNDQYPVEYGTAGQTLVYGTATMTETATVSHGLTTVTFALCSLDDDVDTDAGDPVVCTANVSSNVVTLKLWEDDWSAAETSADVHWVVLGTK